MPDEAARLAGVIDWGDICRADPSLDLSLYWSLFDPPARAAFVAAYGPIGTDRLARARVLALFLCATLAGYAHRESMHELERTSIESLSRTLSD